MPEASSNALTALAAAAASGELGASQASPPSTIPCRTIAGAAAQREQCGNIMQADASNLATGLQQVLQNI